MSFVLFAQKMQLSALETRLNEIKVDQKLIYLIERKQRSLGERIWLAVTWIDS